MRGWGNCWVLLYYYVSVSYVNQWQVFVNVVLAHTQETKYHSGFTYKFEMTFHYKIKHTRVN